MSGQAVTLPEARALEIRRARMAEAETVCEVLRRSIALLCAADHRDDPAALESWLANKAPENVRTWIAAEGTCLLVAVGREGAILGVAAAEALGEVTLNYVNPDARFRGVSSALLEALERWLGEQGHARVTLSSTRTAERFYRARGYREDGPARRFRAGLTAQPMSKALRLAGSAGR